MPYGSILIDNCHDANFVAADGTLSFQYDI